MHERGVVVVARGKRGSGEGCVHQHTGHSHTCMAVLDLRDIYTAAHVRLCW